MLDKVKFIEMLEDLKEFAVIQGNELTQKEIKEFFDEMDLKEENYKHIYTYLAQNQIRVIGFALQNIITEEINQDEIYSEKTKIEKSYTEKSLTEEEPLKEEDSIYLKMYLKDLKTLGTYYKEDEQQFYLDYKNHKSGAKEQVIDIWLPKVVRIAKKYKNRGMSLEDLIQEGNIGLLGAVETVSSFEDTKEMDQFIKSSIEQTIEQALKNDTGEDMFENTLVGRSNLIQEAVNYLAEDLGRIATLSELAEYTRLSEEEIKDIRALSLNAIELGKGE